MDPPSYNFDLITARIRLYYGDQDKYLDSDGMQMLIDDLKNADLKSYLMKDYGHVSFTLGTDNKLFYSDLLDFGCGDENA